MVDDLLQCTKGLQKKIMDGHFLKPPCTLQKVIHHLMLRQVREYALIMQEKQKIIHIVFGLKEINLYHGRSMYDVLFFSSCEKGMAIMWYYFILKATA